MKKIIKFLNYVIDKRKLALIFMRILLTIICILIACRCTQKNMQEKYEAQIREIEIAHAADLESVMRERDMPEYNADAWAIGQWLDCLDERYNLTIEAKSLACWVVINRAESKLYPDTVKEVLEQPMQFCEYSDDEAPTESNYKIASEQLNKLHDGSPRPVPSRAVFITISSEGVVLRDNWEDGRTTGYWRA